MGTDINVRIVKKNRKTNLWEQIKLYRKEESEYKIVNPYPYRNSELFDILSENEEDSFRCNHILINNLPTSLQEEITKCTNTVGYYGFYELTLADLKLYLYDTPKVRDYDYGDDSPKAWEDNPVKYFIECIENYIKFADPYYEFDCLDSDIRILYWFDC